MSHPIDAYDHYGHSHQDKPTTQRLDSNSSSHSSQQPATPRMLRNVSGSLKNSKTDITSIDEGNANHEFGQLLQLHLQHHQQQQQQQQQHQQHQQQHQQHAKQVSLTPQSHIPHSHSRTPSINRVPSYGPVKKKPELLPPAAISSPKPQTQDMPPPASHSSAQSNSHPHPVTPGQPSSNRPNPVTPGQTSSHGPNAGPTSHGQTQPAQTLTQTPTQTPTPTPTPAQAQANAQQFHRKSIGDWDFIKTIGAGSMGKVKLARHNTTGEVCAVKIVPRAAKLFQRAHANDPPVLNPQQAAQRQKDFEKEVARDKRTIREAALGRLLFHPFICRLYEMVPMTNHYYMLFEYVEGGQMLDYIVSHGSLKEKNARKFVRGIASALDYCHKNSVVHRDLKIENIMINQKGDIKIIDFGLSNLYSPTTLLKTYCGSLYFAAPELLSARPYTGPEVDVWSFGVVLYVLVCGKVPFDDKSVSVLHEKIKRGNVEYPEFLSKECVSLLSRMLVVDPLKRATLYEIMQHPWMNRGYDHPPSSYVPKRVPLSLPLDPNIVKSIASFDLGTEAAINQELTNILSSVEYQMSCENWYKISKQGREYNSASNSHLLSDPTAGFHPLISIYYLIDEMKKRKKAKEQAIELQRQQQLQQKQLDLQLNQGSLESLQFAQELQSNTHQQIQQQAQRNTLDTLPATPQVVSTPQVPPAPISEPSHLPELVTAPPPIAFPEAAHTSPTTHSSYKQSAMENPVIPEQQPSSPRPSVSIPETLDPNNGKPANGGFNSILRRLSTKSKHRSSASTSTASKNSGEFNFPANAPPVPVLSINDGESLTPEASYKNDPMVRRGVSMKVTAKERESGSRVNLASPKRQGSQSSPRREPPPAITQQPQPQTQSPQYAKVEREQLRVNTSTMGDSGKHFRSSSATHPSNGNNPNKFLGFVPVEYLPPLPNINNLNPNTLNKDNRKLHPTARAKSVGGHLRKESYSQRIPSQHPPLPNSLATQNSDEIIEAYFDDVTLDDYSDIPPQLNEEQIIEQFNNAKQGSMPSIEYPKTLFLKGFFSVQTTSTKPLPVIRYNIIMVLSKLGVKFQEVKGGFICSHNPSLQEYYPTTQQAHEERELYGDAFKSTSSSIEKSSGSDGGAPRIRTPDQEKTIARQPSLNMNNSHLNTPTSEFKTHRSSNSIGSSSGSGNGHRRKFSIGQSILQNYRKKNGSQVAMPPNTPATAKVVRGLYPDGDDHDDEVDEDNSRGYADGDSVDSMNGIMIGGGSDMLVSSRLEHKARGHQYSTSNASASGTSGGQLSGGKSPLKFEILVVKVPLVGLYGVQFKKILGNTWNYKTLAGQILNDLNL